MTSSEKSLYAAYFPAQWDRKFLYEIAEWQNGLAFKPIDLQEQGVPVIKISEIKAGISSQTKFTSKNFDEKYQIKNGDLLFCWSGQPETSIDTFCWTGPVGWLNQHIFKVTPKTEFVEPQFLYYLLKYLKPSLIGIASNKQTTGLGHVTKSDLQRIEVGLPPFELQKCFVEIIKPVDDRIALMRETNQTLEAIAQALFKSWFVDFEPVRAKAEGRVPEGINEATAALFPDAFDETELEVVPSGWNIEPLDKVASFLNGLALQKFPPTGQDDLPVIKIAQLRKGDTVGADFAAGSIKSEYIIKNGDVLFSWSGSLEVDIWCGGDGALNQHLFKVTSSRFEKWFYYFWTKHHLASFRQIAASKATTMGHIQRGHLTLAKVVVPSDEILAIANELFAPLVDRIVENTLQANTLSNIRDSFLPRLISGQLSIADAETELEKAMA